MAGLFDFLYGEGQALSYIIKGISEGLGLTEITKVIEESGLFTPIPKIEKAYDYIQNVILPSEQYIKQLQLFAIPNLLRIPVSATAQLRNFAYTVSVQGFSSVTGQIANQQITISTNTLLTKQQAIDIAGELAVGVGKSGGLESAAASVTGIQQNVAGLVLP